MKFGTTIAPLAVGLIVLVFLTIIGQRLVESSGEAVSASTRLLKTHAKVTELHLRLTELAKERTAADLAQLKEDLGAASAETVPVAETSAPATAEPTVEATLSPVEPAIAPAATGIDADVVIQR